MTNYIDDDGTEYTEQEALDLFDQSIDDTYPTVSIAGLEWDASRVLRECDPIAYRCYSLDFFDGFLTEA
jgi:hypothetical protein